MEKLGFRNRQIRSMGQTNIDNRYKGGLPGDSPSLMPLDNNLFSNFSKSLLANCCATRHLHHNDPNKFSIADPAKASVVSNVSNMGAFTIVGENRPRY